MKRCALFMVQKGVQLRTRGKASGPVRNRDGGGGRRGIKALRLVCHRQNGCVSFQRRFFLRGPQRETQIGPALSRTAACLQQCEHTTADTSVVMPGTLRAYVRTDKSRGAHHACNIPDLSLLRGPLLILLLEEIESAFSPCFPTTKEGACCLVCSIVGYCPAAQL